ncbi:MAG: hypothetical protein HRT53_11270 [Colwellia sp.]|nr:hypothetical protein [Colwellia sp.]
MSVNQILPTKTMIFETAKDIIEEQSVTFTSMVNQSQPVSDNATKAGLVCLG